MDIKFTVPAVTRDQDDTLKKLLTLIYMDDLYPQDTWIRIYMDKHINGYAYTCIRIYMDTHIHGYAYARMDQQAMQYNMEDMAVYSIYQMETQ